MNKVLEQFKPSRLYDIYTVTIEVRERICGGMPRNKELIKSWVESNTKHKDELSEKLTQENADLVVNEVAEKSWNGFAEDVNGLFIPARNVKACLKQSASLLAITKNKRGSKQILAEGMEVKALDGGSRIYLERDGKKVTKPDGMDEQPIHVMTAQGPRTALRRMDFVEAPTIRFQVWVLNTAAQETRHIGEKELTEILTHAQENGLGASRSQGEGKFHVTEFECKQTGTVAIKAPVKEKPAKK